LISSGSWTITSSITRYNATIAIPALATTGLYLIIFVGAQTSGTFKIGDVQLEAGSTATEFERRPIATELALCQRYYEVGGSGSTVQWSGNTVNAITYFANVYFKVEKRVTPTTIVTATILNAGFPATASTIGASNKYEFRLDRISNSNQNGGYFGDSWTANAEL
jgi:hypothetical protein